MTAFLIDVGGVLVLPDFDPVVRVASEHGLSLSRSDFERAHYWAVSTFDRAHPTDSHGLVDAYAAGVVEILGLPEDGLEAAIEEAFTSSWSHTISDSIDALRAMKAHGDSIAIVSNALGDVEEGLRGICQVGPGPGAQVDVFLDSFHVGVEKPDPRIFDMALEALAESRDDAVHVGDSVVYDVRGAQAAGIRAAHFDPWNLCPDADDHEHVASLSELLTVGR
jgi:putative hydrolase of the HAD superfamily